MTEILAQRGSQRAAKATLLMSGSDPRPSTPDVRKARTMRRRRTVGPLETLPDELLTIEEAAARMKMSVRYVRRLVAERRIAFHRLGRAVRFDPADLAKFVQSGRVEPMTAESVWRDLGSVA